MSLRMACLCGCVAVVALCNQSDAMDMHVDPSARRTLWSSDTDSLVSVDIDGTQVVWATTRPDKFTSLYYLDLADPGAAPQQLLSGYADDPDALAPMQAQISGRNVVFSAELLNSGTYDTFLLRLDDPGRNAIQLSNRGSVNWTRPEIDGNRVVWSYKVGDDEGGDLSDWDIALYGVDVEDLSAGSERLVNGYWRGATTLMFHDLDDDLLAYSFSGDSGPFDRNNNIFLLDLSDPEGQPIELDTASFAGTPVTDGRHVVWVRGEWQQPNEHMIYDASNPAAGAALLLDAPAKTHWPVDLDNGLLITRVAVDSTTVALVAIDVEAPDPQATACQLLVGNGLHQVGLSGRTLVYATDGVLYADRIVPEPTTAGLAMAAAFLALRHHRRRS